MVTFKVKTTTDTNKLASAIFCNMKQYDKIQLSCLGAGAVNQAIKGFITAKGLALPIGLVLTIDPHFSPTSNSNGETLTLIDFIVSKNENEISKRRK